MKHSIYIPLICLFALLPTTQGAKRNSHSYGSIVVDKVNSIYDGDTFRVTIHKWPRLIGENIRIRASGFDTPEIKGKCLEEKRKAQIAKELTTASLKVAEKIELRNMKRGNYFRIITDVYIDGKPLKDIHLQAGTARPYSGGKRKSWCN
jgi:endonuclease YncB( thermonuclease family)